MKKKYRLLIAAVAATALAIVGFSVVQTSKANPPCSGQGGERTTTENNPGRSVGAPAGFIAAGATACQVPVDDAPDGVFLCYSKFQVLPGNWPVDQAALLLKEGYWYPDALPGNVPGGPNLGKYHLVCNATGTPTDKVVNENGEVFPSTYPGSLGYYPLLG